MKTVAIGQRWESNGNVAKIISVDGDKVTLSKVEKKVWEVPKDTFDSSYTYVGGSRGRSIKK
jgi:hypothetical protein